MNKPIMMVAMLSSLVVTTACTAPYQTIHAQSNEPVKPIVIQANSRAEAAYYEKMAQSGNIQQIQKKNESDRLRLLNKLSFYPKPKPRYSRHVIYLPKVAHEKNMKVELIIGTYMQTDCNYYQLIGDFQKKTLYGWGYTYYELGKLKGPMSTMLNCPTTRKNSAFLRVVGTDEFIPYNSEVPVVIYTPSGLEVSYRIWRTDNEGHYSHVE